MHVRCSHTYTSTCLPLIEVLGSGLWGIENKIEPSKSINEAFEKQGIKPLPSSLGDASHSLRKSKVARLLFGSEFIEHFCTTREKEEELHRNYVDEWQLQRYFEII